MTYDENESARWALAVSAATEKHRQATDKAMAEAAARGFMAPPGIFRLALVEASREAKNELAKANGEIYKVRREMLAKDDETEQKYILRLLKVDAEAYRNALENAYRLFEAQKSASLDEYRARIDRMNAETDKHQARIILEKAQVERQVNYWKKLQIIAEGQNLNAEGLLIREKVRTAEVKLSTLDYLSFIVEAERQVLVSEKKKAEALTRVVDASRSVAEIKKAMIPLYLQKAAARNQQAEAIIKETEDKKELERLGYEKVNVTRTKHEADHEIQLAEALYEQAKLEYVRADRLTELFRNQARRMLTDYEEHVRRLVLDLQTKTSLEKAGAGARASAIKVKLDSLGDLSAYAAETQAALSEGGTLSSAAGSVGEAHVAAITASANRKTNHIVKQIIEKQVIHSG